MKRIALLAALALVTGCVSPTDDDSVGGSADALIVDAAHGGRRGFFFLSPLVEAPEPTGVFDPDLSPRIEVRELGTDRLVAAFERGEGVGALRVDVDDEHYAASWHTGDSALDPAQTYRIRVLLDGLELGFADIDVADSGRELRSVSRDEAIPLLDGRTLPIKLRIELGALCDGDDSACTVRVPEDAATAQEAVDRVADQGVVILAPGTYDESVHIVGKQVHVVGDPAAGTGGVRFEQPLAGELGGDTALRGDSTIGIFDYGLRSGGSLRNLTLVGGDGAVIGHGGEVAALGRLDIHDVTMADNGYGVAGTWSSLSLTDVTIRGASQIGYATCGGDQTLINAVVASSGEMGVFAASCNGAPTSLQVDGMEIASNANGGIAVVGDVLVGITNSFVHHNGAFGIFFAEGTSAFIIDSVVADTQDGSIQGSHGVYEGLADGLIASGSSGIVILASQFVDNARSGLLLDASSGTFTNSLSEGSPYGLVLDNGSSLPLVGTSYVHGTEQDVVTDGGLEVPEPPPVPPQP